MSTITAVKKNGLLSIAGDTLTKRGSSKESGKYVENSSKIVSVNGSYIGITGPTSSKLVLRHYFSHVEKKPKLTSVDDIFSAWQRLHVALRDEYFLRPYQDEDDSFESSRMDVIIINEAGIFAVSPHRTVQQFSRFYACGRGAEYALGAMYIAYENAAISAVDVANLGVEAAAEFDDGTGSPIISFSVSCRVVPSDTETDEKIRSKTKRVR